MFDELYEQMSTTDKNDFASTVNHLLSHCFVVRDLFDAREKAIKINPYYRFLERHYEMVNDYLDFIGYSLNKDVILGVFSLYNSHGENRLKIDRETSLILYVLRLIYESEKSETSSTTTGVYITTPTLVKALIEYNISLNNKKLNARSLAKALRFLSSHNLINKVSGSYEEGTVSFYILPSICYAIDAMKVQAMADAIDKINQSIEEKERNNSSKNGGDF